MSEQRVETRVRIDAAPSGTMQLQFGETVVDVAAIRDVSRAGVSVYLHDAVATGAAVTIVYSAPTIALEVSGLVSWCAPVDATAGVIAEYVAGIDAYSPMLLRAALEGAAASSDAAPATVSPAESPAPSVLRA